MATKRNEGLDLLRLISIWFIVCVHYVGWGGMANSNDILMINYAFSGGIAVACNCAVNCFYLISGYFLSDDRISRKRLLKVWCPTWIYSVIIPLMLFAFEQIQLTHKQIGMLFFPILGNQYWFSTCFIFLTLLAPYIYKCVSNVDGKNLIYLSLILVLIDSIEPMFGTNAFMNMGYGVIHAITMLVIGYTIKRNKYNLKHIYSIGIYIVSTLIIIVIIIASILITGDRNRTIADYNSPIVITQSIGMFMLFLNLKIKNIRFSKLAPYVYGVYLLNDNQYARDFLWKSIFKCNYFYNSYYMILHFLIVTISFVIVGICIEFLRIKTFNIIKKKLKGHRHG